MNFNTLNIPTKTLSTFGNTYSNRFISRNKKEKEYEPFFTKTTTTKFYSPISPNHNFNEPLEHLYNNSYYPRTLKKENYKKDINTSLPMLTQFNFFNVVSEPQYDTIIKKFKDNIQVYEY